MPHSPSLFKYDTYLFDLDDTIYNEKEYLFGAYRQIASRISEETGTNQAQTEEDIKLYFNLYGREKLFDYLTNKYDLKHSSFNDFLTILRTITLDRKLEIYPGIKEILTRLTELKKRILVVTNGNPVQQRNKIKQINWSGLDSYLEFILADEIGKKPSKNLFHYIKEKFKIEESKTLMIGDSDIDKLFAQNSDIKYLDVKEIL